MYQATSQVKGCSSQTHQKHHMQGGGTATAARGVLHCCERIPSSPAAPGPLVGLAARGGAVLLWVAQCCCGWRSGWRARDKLHRTQNKPGEHEPIFNALVSSSKLGPQ